MGGGDEINLGLNVNLGLDRSIQDAATLANQIKQMREDQEALNGAMSDTQGKLESMTTEYEKQLDFRTQLVNAENELRSISEAQRQNASDTVASYRELNAVLANLASNMGRIGGGGIGGVPTMGDLLGSGSQNVSGIDGAGQSSGGQSNSTQQAPGGGVGTYDSQDVEAYYPQGINENSTTEEKNAAAQQAQIANILNQLPNTPVTSRLSRVFNSYNAMKGIKKTLGDLGSSDALEGTVLGKMASGAGDLMSAIGDMPGAGPAFVGYEAFKHIITPAIQQGQAYSALTGGTSIAAAEGFNLRADASSWFGLNPLLPTQIAKEIQNTALAQGYKGGLFGQAAQFGDTMYSKYGISPQQSAEMFQTAVVQMGMGTDQLTKSLETLATTASHTNTSFQGLQESFMRSLSSTAAVGMTGSGAAVVATSAAQQFANMPSMKGAGTAIDMLQTPGGQALVASQLGIDPGSIGAYGAGAGGTGSSVLNDINIQLATNEVLADRIQQVTAGDVNPRTIHKNMSKEEYTKILGDNYNFMKIAQVFQSLNIKPPDSSGWTYETMYNEIIKAFGAKAEATKEKAKVASDAIKSSAGNSPSSNTTPGAGGANATTSGAIASLITSGLQAGNQATSGGRLNQFGEGPFAGSGESKLEAEVQALAGKKHWKNVGFDVAGKFISSEEFNKMTDQERQTLQAMVATGQAKVANADKKGKITSEDTYLNLTGHKDAQTAIDTAPGGREAATNKVTVEFGPQAGKLLQILQAIQNDPGKWIKQTTSRDDSSKGHK